MEAASSAGDFWGRRGPAAVALAHKPDAVGCSLVTERVPSDASAPDRTSGHLQVQF